MTEVKAKATPEAKAKFDLQDVLLLVGVICLLAGIAYYSIAAASIALGIICLFFCLLISRAKAEAAKWGDR
jgi:energy-converting hydrogenase Eha subunit C